ncbi:MAG: hypothetical protein AB7H90_03500 [Alphaproteobacteria bacterium]
MSYFTRVDLANRALQHLGVPRISTFADSTRQAREAGFAVDKLRRAELQRSVWTFATRRAVMREVVGTTLDLSFATYAAGTTYGAGDVVKDSNGFLWLSRKASNTGNTPGGEGTNPYWVSYFGPVVAQAHSTSVAYLPGDMTHADNVVYLCLAAHSNQAPPNASYWRAVTGAGGASVITLSPLGYERDASSARKIYRLPANFLRMAPQDPKAASGARLNTTAGMAYNDWEIEEPNLFTDDSSPFVMRFVADVTDVSAMHPLFCEVLAARIATELAEPLTQNVSKKADALALYQQYTATAQTVNAIEAGTTESEPIPEAPAQAQGRR